MKKFLLFIITVGLAYLTAFYTTGKKKGYQSPFNFTWIDNIDFDKKVVKESVSEDITKEFLYDIPEGVKEYPSMVKGYKAFEDKDYSAAIGYFKHAMQEPEMTAKANLMIARSYIEDNKTYSAGQYLDEAVKNAPRNPEAYYYRGKWMFNNSHYKKAVTDLYMATELGIDKNDTYYYLSMAYENQNNPVAALQAALTSVEMDSTFLKGIFQTGRMYYLNKEYRKSADMYSQYLKIVPGDKYSTMNQALCYDYLKEFDSALLGYSRAIEIDPGYVLAYNNRGYFYFEQGEPEKAISDYDKALELNPKYERAMRNRADLYFKYDEFAKAAEDYERLYRTDDDNTSALYYTALSHEKLGDIEKAKRYYKLYVQSDAKEGQLKENARQKIK